jgi:hypothetical protein
MDLILQREEPAMQVDDARSKAAQKGAATVKRRKEERRVERLDEIQDQVADGTLVIRQMTSAERAAPRKPR